MLRGRGLSRARQLEALLGREPAQAQQRRGVAARTAQRRPRRRRVVMLRRVGRRCTRVLREPQLKLSQCGSVRRVQQPERAHPVLAPEVLQHARCALHRGLAEHHPALAPRHLRKRLPVQQPARLSRGRRRHRDGPRRATRGRVRSDGDTEASARGLRVAQDGSGRRAGANAMNERAAYADRRTEGALPTVMNDVIHRS